MREPITPKKIYQNSLPGISFLIAIGIAGAIKSNDYFFLFIGSVLLLLAITIAEYVRRKKPGGANWD